MKIVAYNGSPKGKNSVTHLMLKEILKGAKTAGAETTLCTLAEKTIEHCKGCFHCWYVEKNTCVIKDDMTEVISHFDNMDVLLLATPLYFDNMSGMLKVFLDRCVAYGSYFIEKDKHGESKHIDSFKEKNNKPAPKIVVVSNCGFGEHSQFRALEFMMDRMARNMSTEVIAKILRSQGPLLQFKNEHLNPIIISYKSLLQQAGTQLVTQGKISKDLQKNLEQPLIPVDIYNEHINNR